VILGVMFALAAVLEIAGCFMVWTWWRGASIFWLIPAALALAGFAMILASTPSAAAGRSFAAYGGIYIAASLAWMWGIERVTPTGFDLAGLGLALAGACVILLGAR
jgi:small multidrug resistance family-3 protein